MLAGGSSVFLLSVTGQVLKFVKIKNIQRNKFTAIQVEEGEFPDHDHLYCRLFWVADTIKTYTNETHSILFFVDVSGVWSGLATDSGAGGRPFTGHNSS